MEKYGTGIYRIVKDDGGWCVAKKREAGGRWLRVSNFYRFRGWAENFARRMHLNAY